MANPLPAGLNVSGEAGVARVFSQAALHLSRGERTTTHAHYAWKLHLGLDAPVWLNCPELKLPPAAGVRGILIPPNLSHSTGAVGGSIAVFFAPGSRHAPWRDDARPRLLDGRMVDRLLSLPLDTADGRQGSEVVELCAEELFPRGVENVDSRVAHCLRALQADPGKGLGALARDCGVSLDHLSRLVRRETGLVLRRHVLWGRLLRALTLPGGNLASVAQAAGFADHAHMTRTFRACLGRAPSEFVTPPEVVAPWSS
ncbi:MAG: helix-turn-helix transcriptional regulator [Polyangiaceae bacterium]|nr:helix-turn-helix transcriptional regulator [Myxococcales bacterium]MCB9584112.1 helix-turn-helix transcriptional regulator [Polyangiaceae bacterium]